jgi:hypothetical protein
MKHFKEVLIFMSLIILALPVVAQKGTGSQTGIVRESTDAELSEVSGIIKEVKIGPCENSTGRSNSGTHLIVSTDNNSELNIHLGPTNEVSSIVKDLSPGLNIKCKVFRTDNLPDNNYIALDLETDSQFYLLRDSNLRPFWAGKGRLQ